MDQREELNKIIERSRRIVFFGGAGVSTASGIPDFRSEDGIYDKAYNGVPPEEILSTKYFALHTKEFYDFYRKYMVHPKAEPNCVHRWLAELEKEDKLRGIVTQNIDGLHKKAGNKRIYELHGSIYENYCVHCETSYPLEKIMNTDGVPRCDKCGGIIKPWVVLYGEAPDKYTCIGACREISNADTMIVAGTSLAVEPAASFIDYFAGKNLIVINREPTPADSKATLLIRGAVEDYLGTELKNRVVHPFGPLYSERSRVLILGSFPSVKSREQAFFYGHPQNRFWKVIAAVTGNEVPKTIEEKKELILSSGLALWDSIGSCEITGSSDASIRNAKPNDIKRITDNCDIRAIYCNGKKSLEIYNKYIAPTLGRKAEALPSTSPANAAWSLERLTEAWSVILDDITDR